MVPVSQKRQMYVKKIAEFKLRKIHLKETMLGVGIIQRLRRSGQIVAHRAKV